MTESLININGDSIQTLEIIMLTTLISLMPSLVVMMTSFTRYIISLSFLRTALGTQQTPPNLVLVGMALFLTLITMRPVLTQIQTQAYEPYVNEQISQEEFLDRAAVPLKEFMVRNTTMDTLGMFAELSEEELPQPLNTTTASTLPLTVIVPAFITHELKRAFEIGFLLYIPFMLLDVVVSTTLMSMGMIMLPPAMISMPFKLLLFITVDGWELLFSALIRGVF